MKASAPGLAAASLAHIAGAEGRKAFLTIATEKEIHTLTNQTSNGFVSTSNKGHNDVGRALENAANSVLIANGMQASGPVPKLQPDTDPHPVPEREVVVADRTAPGPTLAERLRELAELHNDDILSDEEFAAAKASLLGKL